MGENSEMTGQPKPEMTAVDVLGVVQLFEAHGVEVILDGGWAVDALLGEQTRLHDDLDIAMPHHFVPLARQLLEARGYIDAPRADTRDCNFVMEDGEGHSVDFHSYEFDERGQLLFGLPYPPESLTGHGSVVGYPVRCITAVWLVQFHTGYSFDEVDYQDVKALCEQFGLDMPDEYRQRGGG